LPSLPSALTLAAQSSTTHPPSSSSAPATAESSTREPGKSCKDRHPRHCRQSRCTSPTARFASADSLARKASCSSMPVVFADAASSSWPEVSCRSPPDSLWSRLRSMMPTPLKSPTSPRPPGPWRHLCCSSGTGSRDTPHGLCPHSRQVAAVQRASLKVVFDSPSKSRTPRIPAPRPGRAEGIPRPVLRGRVRWHDPHNADGRVSWARMSFHWNGMIMEYVKCLGC